MESKLNEDVELTLAICIYNAAKYLEDALKSVLAQTRQDFHLLLVDDCSTDASVNVVKTFFEGNPRQYELVTFERNSGPCYARSFSLNHVSTKYLMFFDADDILLPDAVEKLLTKIKSDASLIAVGCYLKYIDESGRNIPGGIYLGSTTKETFIERAAQNKLIFMASPAIFLREAALSVGWTMLDGYPQGETRWQDYCEDLDLWTRMSDMYVDGKAIIVIPEVLCLYRKHNGLSSCSFNMFLKMRYIKYNLLRRRSGKKDISFVEYYSSLSKKAMDEIKRNASAADLFRKGVFMIRSGRIMKGVYTLLYTIVLNPCYFIDKIKNNLIKR